MSEAIKPVWSAGFKTVTVQETEKHVAADIRVFCGNPDFTKRISRLIAEAGTVHHETGLTPRQLLEQRDALVAALAGLDEAYCRAGTPLSRDERTEDRKRLIAARAALALVKGEKP
jgi:hypothetical protein